MSDAAAFDTDILTKCSCYQLLDRAFGCVSQSAILLGAARYAVPGQLKRLLAGAAAGAIAHFEGCLGKAIVVEPTAEETELAAALELLAQKVALPLDAGESQLAAVVVVRSIALLVTVVSNPPNQCSRL